jgi:hypothetical protein
MLQPETILANADMPGLLRLPPELRFEIYEYLLTPVLLPVGSRITNSTIDASTSLFKHSVVRVCHHLRYETIAWVHSQFILVIPFWLPEGRFIRSVYLAWLNCVDAYAVQCLKGIVMTNFRDKCSSCGLHDGDEIVVEWSGDVVRLRIVPEPECCPVKVLHDRRRAYLARTFVREANAVGSVTKQNIINLIRGVDDVGR